MDGRPSCWRAVIGALLLLLLTEIDSAAAGYCTQGSEWIEYNGNCYRWTRLPAENWFRAELVCRRFGGHLASVPTPNDNNFLLRLTQCRNNFWIGMVNTVHALKAQPRGYEWWDGTSHNYTRLILQGNNYQDCVHSDHLGNWHNVFCQNGYSYVCKAPAAQGSLEGKPIPATEQRKQHEAAEAVWQNATIPVWPTPTAAPVKCQPGWQQLDRSCYFTSDNRTNYFNAQMSCQALGGNVASVLTLREHTLLTVALGCNSPAWIGLEKARPCFKQPNKDHCWVWMDRSPVNYFEWSPGHPVDQRDSECVVLDGQWRVTNCYAEFRYICKKSL